MKTQVIDLGVECEDCPEKHYPQLYVGDIELPELPYEFTAKVVLCKKSETCRYEEEGEEECSYTFEVKSIEVPIGKSESESDSEMDTDSKLEVSIASSIAKYMKGMVK